MIIHQLEQVIAKKNFSFNLAEEEDSDLINLSTNCGLYPWEPREVVGDLIMHGFTVSTPQITWFLLGDSIVLSKASLCSGSMKQKRWIDERQSQKSFYFLEFYI